MYVVHHSSTAKTLGTEAVAHVVGCLLAYIKPCVRSLLPHKLHVAAYLGEAGGSVSAT